MVPCTAPNKLFAAGRRWLFPESRDIRGIETSYKITREASSPANKGCPRSGTRRSVKPSAQPTLVRTQHPPPRFLIYICEFGVAGLRAPRQMQRSSEP